MLIGVCCVFLQYCSQQRHSTLWRRKSRDHRQKSVRKEERREAGKPEEDDEDDEEDDEDSEGVCDSDLTDEESPDEKDVCSLDEKDEVKEETDVSNCINDILFEILDPAHSSSSVFLIFSNTPSCSKSPFPSRRPTRGPSRHQPALLQ